MSRVKRLKERRRKRKNKIKTTSCCLTLALAMGISQGIGTYALFTDTENVPSDISLSTGDVDVEVSKGFEFKDLAPEESRTHQFTITNHGTLRQHIKLSVKELIAKDLESLTDEQNKSIEYLMSKLEYNISFKKDSKVIMEESGKK